MGFFIWICNLDVDKKRQLYRYAMTTTLKDVEYDRLASVSEEDIKFYDAAIYIQTVHHLYLSLQGYKEHPVPTFSNL